MARVWRQSAAQVVLQNPVLLGLLWEHLHAHHLFQIRRQVSA